MTRETGCPCCGSEGFRKDTPAPIYECTTPREQCRVETYRVARRPITGAILGP